MSTGRKFLWIAIPIWIVLAALGGWLHLRQGIYVNGDFLYRSGADCYRRLQDEIRITESGTGTEFEVTYDGIKDTATLVWGGQTAAGQTPVCVTFQDQSTVEGIWDGKTLCDADGRDLAYDLGEIVVTPNGKRPPVSHTEWSRIFCRLAIGDTETRGSIVFLLIGTIAYALGILGFLFPDKAHFLFRRWQYDRAELSDAGIFVTKASGIVVMILGAVMMLQLFLL